MIMNPGYVVHLNGRYELSSQEVSTIERCGFGLSLCEISLPSLHKDDDVGAPQRLDNSSDGPTDVRNTQKG